MNNIIFTGYVRPTKTRKEFIRQEIRRAEKMLRNKLAKCDGDHLKIACIRCNIAELKAELYGSRAIRVIVKETSNHEVA